MSSIDILIRRNSNNTCIVFSNDTREREVKLGRVTSIATGEWSGQRFIKFDYNSLFSPSKFSAAIADVREHIKDISLEVGAEAAYLSIPKDAKVIVYDR